MKIAASPLPNSPASGEGHASQASIDDKSEGAFADVLASSKKATQKSVPADNTAGSARADAAVSSKTADKDEAEIDERKAKHDDRHKPHLETTDPLSLMMALRALHQAPLVNPADKNAAAAPRMDENALAKMQAATLPANADAPALAESAAELLAELAPASAKGKEPKIAMPSDKTAISKGEIRFDSAPTSPAISADQTNADMAEPIIATKSTARSAGTPVVLPQADRQANRVTIVGEQNFPAPAAYQTSQTATNLAGAIANDTGMRQVFSASAGLAQPSTPVAHSSHTLKIELHPAELGMVTANLRLAGGQLSIELTPENHEAHRRLSADTESLVKSLRGMGFDVDKVTVLQPSIAINGPARADASAMTGGPAGRDASSFQSGNSGGDGNNSSGQQSARNRNNDGQHSGQNAPQNSGRTGGDLFI